MSEDDRARDDGLPWGYIAEDLGDWVMLLKGPMLVAGLGPPPFDITLPDGRIRRVIHQPLAPGNYVRFIKFPNPIPGVGIISPSYLGTIAIIVGYDQAAGQAATKLYRVQFYDGLQCWLGDEHLERM